ncbi:hypothetical protein PFISCL1PPCAC_3239, partial [Pristionchus fissidentatus]
SLSADEQEMRVIVLLLLFHAAAAMILRGKIVRRSSAPRWMVSYHTDSQHQFNCGGTLISPRIIHTAGHCLKKATNDNHFVVTLNNYLADTPEKSDIKRTGSDWYLRTRKHDLEEKKDDYGLIFLDEPVDVCEDMDSLLVPIIIDSSIFPNETAVLEPAAESCVITGWGMNEKGRYDPPLREARLQKWYTARGMIVAVKYDNDARACNGDSGSPLVCNVNNIPVLIGNVAGGIAINEKAVADAEEDWQKCDLRRDVYAYINRQMPVLEKQIRKRGMWNEFVATQKRCVDYYMSKNGGQWIHEY